jgi:nitric oxide reductase NorE protein
MNQIVSTENPIADDPPVVSFANKGVWIFVGIDMAIFGLFFLIFMVEKSTAPLLFGESRQALNAHYGFINTMILITSSWLLVKSLRIMEVDPSRARGFLGGSILFGSAFIVLKFFEYGEKFSAGISIVENTFFTFYFLLTFIHFCHVLGGLVALSVMFSGLKKGTSTSLVYNCESVGIYWHMVDLLWVYLFLLLYLLP